MLHKHRNWKHFLCQFRRAESKRDYNPKTGHSKFGVALKIMLVGTGCQQIFMLTTHLVVWSESFGDEKEKHETINDEGVYTNRFHLFGFYEWRLVD